MTTNFPTSIDTNTTLENGNVDAVNIVDAATDNNQSDAIMALEAKVGANASAVTTSLDYQMENHAHTAGTDDGGAVSHANLTGVTADQHHAQSHGSEHAAGGSDPIVGAPAVRTVGADYFIFKSGSNFIAYRTADGATPYTSTNAASVINSAAAVLAAANGGVIELEGKTTFTCQSTITIGGGVTLRGSRIASEGNTNTPLVIASSNLGSGATGTHPLINLNGGGAAAVDINTNAQANATEAIFVNASACAIRGGLHQGGTVHTIANATGTARQRWHDMRIDGNNNPSTSVMELFSTDSIVYGFVTTGCKAGGSSTIINGNNNEIGLAHITGDSGSADALVVTGDGCGFVGVKVDTCGTASTALIKVTGNHNSFAACSAENLPDGQSRPVLAIQGWGNQFTAFEYAKAAGGGQATGLIKFGSGSTPANLGAFLGTRVEFSAANLDLLSGSLCNRMPTATEAVWIQGYVSSGTASAGNGTYNYYPNHS